MRDYRSSRTLPAAILALAFILAACRQAGSTPTALPEGLTPTADGITESSETSTEVLPTINAGESNTHSAQVMAYDLGEATIIQDWFPEDSRFRNMPVRLDGVIGVPDSKGQHPVVLIMHGSHVLCTGEHAWPCAQEQKNFEGFSYLVEELANAGYVALAINVNAEHTDAFGEGLPAVRTKQLIDLHLGELAAANAGESNSFGLDLTGRADLSKLVWLGHSRGAEYANRILREYGLAEMGDAQGYGPVQGLIQVAPALVATDSLPAADLPLGTILPACDQDFVLLDGQRFYETARFDPDRSHLAAAVYLEGAIHNYFNANLDAEFSQPIADRPDCTADTMISAEAQQEFLVKYAVDFLQMLYAEPGQARSATQHLGILPSEPSTGELYGVPAKINLVPESFLPLVVPLDQQELTQSLVDGDVQLDGVTATFCPEGYFGPNEEFGSGACKRFFINQPGHPQQLHLAWDSSGATWRTTLPDTMADLSPYVAIQMRVAPDPLSDLNVTGKAQSFTLALVDNAGKRAQVTLPEIPFPAGVRKPDDFADGDRFTGHVYMQTIRVPFEAFTDVDISAIKEIALLFDQTGSGALFFADLVLVRDDP